MEVSQILEKMIQCSRGNVHDIEHFVKVWAYARAIGKLEGLDPEAQFILEAAAITHDIACPVCREKYGDANGKLQERESPPLIAAFFDGTDVKKEQLERISFLVGHHHTYEGVNGMDWQILLDADYLVNASESHYPAENILNYLGRHTVTSSGKRFIQEIFGIQDSCRTVSP